MTNSETRRYEMLVRIRGFGEAHTDLFPKSSLAREQFAAVAAVVKELSAHAVAKMSAAREGRGPKTAARAVLLERLEAVALTGRAMAQNTPGFGDKFRLPDPQSDQALITAGRLFAREADAFKRAFVAHAMPSSFIDDLNQAVDEFESAIHERESGKAESAAARACIKTTLATGTAAVVRLDAMVTNHLRDDPKMMAIWKRERRVGNPARRRSAPAAPVAPVAVPATPAQPVAQPTAATSPAAAPAPAALQTT